MLALSKIVPPPTFLTMPCVGVDISDTSLKYVEFEPTMRTNKEKILKQWGDINIPNGIVQRGHVEDEKKLSEILKEFKANAKAEFVRVSLPEERAYLFETDVKKGTPIREIKGLLEFRLEENVPIPSKDVFFDYTTIPSPKNPEVIKIAVAAYAKETIQKYFNACVEAGLHPVSFEVEAQAMARAVIPKDTKGASMLVDFGKTRTGVGVIYKGILLYTSTIDVGGEDLSRSLRAVLGENVAESELTNIKNTQGLIRGVDDTGTYDALISVISAIKEELSTRMQYWHLRTGNSDERRINSIQLTGGSSNLKGLPTYLSEALGVPTVKANVWENAFSLDHHVPPIELRKSLGYSTAIGLALGNTNNND